MEIARSSNPEVYKGHVMQVMIAILPTDSIVHMIQKALALCYLRLARIHTLLSL